MNKKVTINANKKTGLNTNNKTRKIFYWIIFFSGFLLYGNTLRHTYVLDDNIAIYGNKLVQKGIWGIPEILTKSLYYGGGSSNSGNYRPLVSVVFAIEKEFFGKNGYRQQHFIQVLLYALLGVGLFKFLLLLFKEKNLLVPFLITLFYMAHPVHTEVTANIKSLDEILYFLLGYILTMTYLLQYIDSKEIKKLYISFFFFFLGLFSKESAITFIAAIPCTLYFFTKERNKRIAILTIPYFVIGLLYLLVRNIVLEDPPVNMYGTIDNVLLATNNLSEKYATNFVFLLKYLQLLVFPHPLTWDYSYNQIPLTNWADMKAIVSLCVHLGMAGYAIYELRKKNIYSFCILFYFITMSLSSNLFVTIGGTIGERFLFAPSLAFAMFLTLIIIRITKTVTTTKEIKINLKLIGICTLILLPYFIKTYSRNKDWKDQYSIMSTGVEVSPNSAKAHGGLGSYFAAAAGLETNPKMKNDLFVRAIHEYEQVVAIYPKDPFIWSQFGNLYYQYGDYEKAEMAYKKNIALNPQDVSAYNNIAGLYYFKKEYDTALIYFKKFVDHNPNDTSAIANLGVVYMDNLKDTLKALPYFLKAIEIDSNYLMLCEKVGNIYYKKRDYPNAIKYLTKAYNINPSNKELIKKIADMYFSAGETKKAIQCYQKYGAKK